MSAPRLAPSGDCLQQTHFIKADSLPPSGAMAVNFNYSVFLPRILDLCFRTRFGRSKTEDRDAKGYGGLFRD